MLLLFFFVEKQRLFFQCISIQILCIFDVHCSPSSEPLGKKNVKHLWSLEVSQRLTYLKGDVHRMHAVVSCPPCLVWCGQCYRVCMYTGCLTMEKK